MKRKHLWLWMLPITALVFIAGCGSGYTRETAAELKLTPAKGLLFGNMRVFEDDERTVVAGTIKRTFNNCCNATRGHIDIAVTAPDGTLLDVVSAFPMPRKIPKDRGQASRFRICLPYTLPQDVTLSLTYHDKTEMAVSPSSAPGAIICGYQQG